MALCRLQSAGTVELRLAAPGHGRELVLWTHGFDVEADDGADRSA